MNKLFRFLAIFVMIAVLAGLGMNAFAELHSKWSAGDLVFYDGATDIFVIRNGTDGVKIFDDLNLTFGTDNDATIVYDETTDNKLEITCSNGFTLTGVFNFATDTDASSLTVASVVYAGGVAITKQLYIGDDIDMSVSGTGTYDITLKDSVGDALSIVRGTTDVIVFDTSTPRVTITPTVTITGAVVCDDTTASTSGLTGSVQTDGGLGVVGNTFLTGTLTVGADAAGTDFTVYGVTTLYKTWWDANGDANGAWYFGTDDYGVDVNFYGQHAGDYALWDASANKLVINIVDEAAANKSAITADATIDGALGYYYGVQSNIAKSGAYDIDDCTAVTAYINQTTGDFTLTGRFAPLQTILSGSGTVGTITKTGSGAVHAAWIANRGTQTNTDSVLCVHNQSAATAVSAIEIENLGSMTNLFEIDAGATTYLLKFLTAEGPIVSDTSNLPTAATYKIKCKVDAIEFYLIGVADF